MTESIFTIPDAWNGGSFELLLFFGDVANTVITDALTTIWNSPCVVGYWLKQDVEPADQRRFVAASVAEHLGERLRGIATLSNGKCVACYSSIVDDENGKWLDFGLPMGSLGRAYPVGAYPFDDGLPTDWIEPVSEWLREVASRTFAAVRFEAGEIGWLTTLEVDEILEIAAGRIPEERWHGCLKRNGDKLDWFPRNVFRPLMA